MNRLVQFIRLPARDRLLLIEAVSLLTLASGLIPLLSFQRIVRRLGEHMADSPDRQETRAITEARRIRWAVSAGARHLPWHPVCLPQAVTAKVMLRRRHIPATLYLGVDRGSGFDAHAWVRVGRVIVTGAPEHKRFSIVSMFA